MNKAFLLGLALLSSLAMLGQSSTISDYFTKDYQRDTRNRVLIGYNIRDKGIKLGYERIFNNELGLETGLDITSIKELMSADGFLLNPISYCWASTLKLQYLTDIYLRPKVYSNEHWSYGLSLDFYPFIPELMRDVGIFTAFHQSVGRRMFLEAEAGFGFRFYRNNYKKTSQDLRSPLTFKIGYYL